MSDKKKVTYNSELPEDVQRLLEHFQQAPLKESSRPASDAPKKADVEEDVIRRLIRGMQKK